jgi:putative copper export protein/methionine-rich copper-binding protein CopC
MRRARSGALAVAASLFLFPALVYAHGALRKSVPANGAVLHAAPRVIRLTFNEPPQLAFTRVELVGPDSERVALSPLRVAASDSTEVVLADVAGPLRAGRYRILWQITSTDGHPVRGVVAFSLAPDATGLAISAMDSAAVPALPSVPGDTTAPRAGGSPRSAPRAFDAGSWPYAIVRLLTFTAIMIVVGAIVFAMVVVPGTHHRVPDLDAAFVGDARRSAARLALAATGMLALLLVARLVAQSYAVRGMLPDATFALGMARTSWGAGFLLTAVSLAGLAIALGRRRGAAWRVAALGALGLSLATALSGHATASGRWTTVAVFSDTVHILAAGGWLGALLVVIVAGVPATVALQPSARGSAVRGMVDVFSPMALFFAAALAVTGVVAAVLRLGAWGALTGSDYGRVLLLKLSGVVLVLIAGAYNWRRMRPTLGADRVGTFRRTATVELLFGFVVLVVTAWLVATPPPAE